MMSRLSLDRKPDRTGPGTVALGRFVVKFQRVSVPLLEMSGIVKRFPGVIAADDVSLTVDRHEIVALVGENGAGKSTLMKILAGLHRPDAGDITIDGVGASMRGPEDAAKLGIAVIHQELEVIDNLDVAGNVFLGREPVWAGPLRLVDRARLYADTRACLDRLGVELSPHTTVRDLSTAQQQFVAIARALSTNARLLIMDEPTSSLTLADSERLFRVIRDLRSRGVGIIYISHRLDEIDALADRVVVLRDGRNAGSLARDEISRERMVQLMVGRPVARRHTGDGAAIGGDCLRVEGVRTARYPQHAATLTVRRGEIMGVAGLIGAGRTELAESICGMQRRSGGRVLLDGEVLSISTPGDAIRHGIYLVPEDRRRVGVIGAMSVRENISLPALGRFSTLGLVRRGQESASAVRVAAQLQIKSRSVEIAVDTLSGGNQQKVGTGAVAVAGAPRPRLRRAHARYRRRRQGRDLSVDANTGGGRGGDPHDQQ